MHSHSGQLDSRVSVALRRRAAEPTGGFIRVMGHAVICQQNHPQVELSNCIALPRRQAPQPHGLSFVFENNVTRVVHEA